MMRVASLAKGRPSVRFAVTSLIAALAIVPAPTPAAAPLEWRALDVDHNGRLDQADIRQITAKGIFSPSIDVNGDGKKDIQDAFALATLITRLDRTGDRAVSKEDFAPGRSLTVPEPSEGGAARVVAAALAEAKGRVPADLEQKLEASFAAVPGGSAVSARAALYDQAGAAALAVHNLDEARFGFAKAATLAPKRDSALANLGFVLAEEGRYPDALVLLARARQLQPRSCTTLNNLGFVMARAGELADALRYHSEAVVLCPQGGILHLNLGVVQLRAGQEAAARASFEQALRLDPRDADAFLMGAATAPPGPPSSMAAQAAAYEQRRARDTELPPWDEMDPVMQVEEVLSMEGDKAKKGQQEAIEDLKRQFADRAKTTAAPALAQGKSACEDLTRCFANRDQVLRALAALRADARRAVIDLQSVYDRKAAGAELALDSLLLQNAVTHAQAGSVAIRDATAARKEFERTVDELYSDFMRRAARDMTAVRTRPDFDIWDNRYQQAVILCFMPPMATLKPGYSDSLDKCGVKPDASKLQFSGSVDAKLGASLGLVALVWTPEENAWKLQVGQGVLVAGTWSPERGFGFQVGAGVEIEEGHLKAGAVEWIKFGSDGSITLEGEVGATASFTTMEGGVSTEIRAAPHEPVGTL
jgi:tetratricopeptide (TPR) repeat protein